MSALILAPLRVLRDLLRGPRNLIKKRLDKLLDYELISEKSSLSYEEQAVASTYRWAVGEGEEGGAAQVISDSASSHRTINTLLVNELPQFNSLALQMIWSVLGTFSCLHRDLAADMEQLFHSFAQQVSSASAPSLLYLACPPPLSSFSSPALPQLPRSSCLLGVGGVCSAGRCQKVREPVSQHAGHPQRACGPGELGPAGTLRRRLLRRTRPSDRLRLRPQPLSPSSQRRLKQLMDKHGSGKIYQVVGTAVASRDLDLNLAKGDLVAVLSESDTRGDRRRWLVDAGGQTLCSWLTFKLVVSQQLFSLLLFGAIVWFI